MRFQQVGRTHGDETTPYKVSDFKSRTVGEFIQEVLRENPNEWGYISVGGHFYQSRKMGSCERSNKRFQEEFGGNNLFGEKVDCKAFLEDYFKIKFKD